MDWRELWDRDVPKDVQRDMVRMVGDIYRRTHDDVVTTYARPEARDVEPHIRRAEIESALIELQERFPEHLEIEVGQNRRNNSHRSLLCGQFRIIQSYVPEGRRVPRDAEYRNGFAWDPNQMMIDREAEAARAQFVNESRIFVILTHAPAVGNPGDVGLVTVVLVDKECRYVDEIDLLRRVALDAHEWAHPEHVPDQVTSRLRKIKGKAVG